MKILRMNASFGKLRKQTLELRDGLNILTAPNEAGKSTWAAFLLAMLYGVDSSERTTKTNLPAKTRFKPWDGSAMEGRLEVEHQGRRITIERSSKGRVPMGEFRAYDSDTGLSVPELTADNCGQRLLGVERSIFERSAFVGQSAAAVTADPALEKRLAALVTTGQEDISFSDSQKRLKDWKNHCRHNKTGLLPKAEEELAQVRDSMEQVHQLHKEELTSNAALERLENERNELREQLAALDAQALAQRFRQREQVRLAAEEAAAHRDALQTQCEKLPEAQSLLALRQELGQLERDEAELPGQALCEPEPPDCPPVFAGLKEEEILPKARRDKTDFDRLTAGKYVPLWGHWLRNAFLCLGFAAAALTNSWERFRFPLILLAVCLAVCVWLTLRQAKSNRAYQKNMDQAEAILKAYGYHSGDELVPFAADYHEKLLLYIQQREAYEKEKREQAEKQQALVRRRARLFGQISMLDASVETTEQALGVLDTALSRHQAAGEAARAAGELERRYEAVCTALGDVAQPPVISRDISGLERGSVQLRLRQSEQAIVELEARKNRSQGRVQMLGDPAVLQAREEALTERVDRLEKREKALELALSALEDANAQLQTRFAPQISALSGELLAKLTGQRYDTVLLDQELRAQARESGEAVTRQLLYLSGGTADQVYLAVRLAICRLVLGEDSPIVLDDALVRFDDTRMLAALRLLQEEAKSRQILLFTCQSREQAALEKEYKGKTAQ